MPHSCLLITRGRKTGRLRRNPVTLVEHDGRRWLVAPYGPVSWVHNARAAGGVQLSRRATTGQYAIREIPPAEAGPVLKQYVHIARVTRPYFHATADSPVEDFVAEAALHPVFELTAVDDR
jgi:deazaflavin-dependent oxidoreductase (nitroreductase family)